MDNNRVKYLQDALLSCLDNRDYNSAERVINELRVEFFKPTEIKLSSLHFETFAPDWQEYFEKHFNIKFVEEDEPATT